MMNGFYRIAAIAGFACTAAVPVFAASHVMDPARLTCGDVMAMDAEGQLKAVEAMQKAAADLAIYGDDATAGDTDAKTEDDVLSMEEAMMAMEGSCEGHADMLAMNAMLMKHKNYSVLRLPWVNWYHLTR